MIYDKDMLEKEYFLMLYIHFLKIILLKEKLSYTQENINFITKKSD